MASVRRALGNTDIQGINNLAPAYISQLLVHYNQPRSLRSDGKYLLEAPKVHLKTYRDRAFSVAAPKLWNDLPLEIKIRSVLRSLCLNRV